MDSFGVGLFTLLGAAVSAVLTVRRRSVVALPAPAPSGIGAAPPAGGAPDSSGSHGSGRGGTVFNDPNFPRDDEGRVHHLQLKAGDVAARILSVGDSGRAKRISELLDAGSLRVFGSSRGFTTYTGTFNGVSVSIIATGMGTPMMDFIVRETRPLVEGRMAILRYGTCGGLRGTPTGTVVVSTQGAIMIRREPDAVGDLVAAGTAPTDPAAAAATYSVSRVVMPDAELSALYEARLRACIGSVLDGRYTVVGGMGATADSFYSSQGRITPHFRDANAGLIDYLESRSDLTQLRNLEMETFHLLDLARSAMPRYPIAAAGAAMVLANRHGTGALQVADLPVLEREGGRAALQTLTQFKL